MLLFCVFCSSVSCVVLQPYVWSAFCSLCCLLCVVRLCLFVRVVARLCLSNFTSPASSNVPLVDWFQRQHQANLNWGSSCRSQKNLDLTAADSFGVFV